MFSQNLSYKYDFFEMDINEMKGPSIIIHKSNDYILIVTAFDVMIPEYILTFNQFITMNLVTLIAVFVSWYVKFNLSVVKLFICAVLYSLLCCVFCFILLAFFYPMLCVSSLQIETSTKNSENQFSSMDLECQVISSTRTCSQAWWDDIGK
jgi:ABC-type Fe3+-siderophore transport system permease subunit